MIWINVEDKLPEDLGYGESLYCAVWVENEGEEPFWMQARYDHIKEIFKTLEDKDLLWERIRNVKYWTYIDAPTKRGFFTQKISSINKND